ncbi:MAG TPA: rod shape-determining protein MreC [Aggregatilineales bacterium]|nr:rod shape-determining protein MreC [Aggregatilineales bacterium]
MRSASNRLIAFGVAVFLCVILMSASLSGVLGPVEGLASIPIGLVQGVSRGVTNQVTSFANNLSQIQSLQQRNAELERAAVNFQAEIVELREVKADYDRLAKLLNYKDANADKTFLPATVIGRDTTGLLRSLTLDRGTRDGVKIGMPVVTDLGLVGRIYRVSATNAQVQLITDNNSYVNTRLQTTRGEGEVTGSVTGTAGGDLLMTFIPLTSKIQEHDSVVTSGLGGNFPRGLLVGQVESWRADDSRLFQEARVRSLVEFNGLEIVLIITSFQPVDLSAFGNPTSGAPGQ